MKPKNKDVRPITDAYTLNKFLNQLKRSGNLGERDYAIFQTGKATLLRVSDVLKLRKNDVYQKNGRVKKNAYIIDQKTHKSNTLYLKPVRDVLEDYYDWLKAYQQKHTDRQLFTSQWLFPSSERPNRHITGGRYYKIVHQAGLKIGIDWVGSHTMRKTGAFMVYEQSGHNIGLVMKLLNHSSEGNTLRYLGLDQARRENILDTISFDRFN